MYRKRLKNFYDLLEAGNYKKLIIEVDKLLTSVPQQSVHHHQHTGACCHGPSTGKQKGQHSHSHEGGGVGYDEQTSLVISKALKSLALVRTGRKQEADQIIDDLLNSFTSDENALSIIMQYCKETQQLSKIVSFYENAVNKCESNSNLVGTQEHEEMLSSLFYAYVRNRDFAKQQQVALKLYKQTNNMMYCFWNAASYVMQSKPDQTSQQQPQLEQKRALYMQLGEKILQKAYEDKKMEYNGEFLLYLSILEQRKKFEEALKIVENVEESNLSKIGQVDFKIRKKIEYFNKMKNWTELRKVCEEYLKAKENIDDWLHYLTYLDSIMNLLTDPANKSDEFIQSVLNFFNDLKNNIEVIDPVSGSKSDKAQGPYLARIEYLNRIFKLRDDKSLILNDTKFNEALLKEYLTDYISMFNSKPGFYYDFIYFKDLIAKYKLKDFVLDLLKNFNDKSRPFSNIKSIYTCLSYWQMHRFFGEQNKMTQQELLQLAIDLEKMYLEALEFGKDLLSTAFQYADEYLILAVHIRYDLFQKYKDDSNNLLQLIVNLKQGLVHSPSNYQLKLLLLNLYSLLGSYESIQKMYDSMDIKNIQNYSTANLLLVHNLRLGALGASISTYDRMNQFFTSNLFDMANFLVNSYKYGTFLKAAEMCEFMDTIKKSLTLNICLTNFIVISFIMQSTNLAPVSGEITLANPSLTSTAEDESAVIISDFKQLKSKVEQHLKEIASSSMAFNSETGLLIDENDKLLDHNDKDVLYHWDPSEEQELAKKQYNYVIDEQKKLLRLRNIIVRLFDVCLNRWLETDEVVTADVNEKQKKNLDFYKKVLNDFDYSFNNKNDNQSDDLSDNSEEISLDSELKIYITKSNYLKRWSQLNLDKILNLFVNLSTDLCESEIKFLDKEQENKQVNLILYRDSLKNYLNSLKARFDSILGIFEMVDVKPNPKFKVELVNRVLECFSSSLECFSFIVTIFTLCLSSKTIKPIWNEKLKKSKKKKTLYLQYAASIDLLFEIYELLCQIINYFVNQLKQKICPNIVSLTESKFSGIKSTIKNGISVQNHLNDITQSYLKSFNELKNFFIAKLKLLAKFSGNINVQLENLKLN